MPVLKLFGALVHNRGGRISFKATSADGIRLFKHAAQVVKTYCARLQDVEACRDALNLRQRLPGLLKLSRCSDHRGIGRGQLRHSLVEVALQLGCALNFLSQCGLKGVDLTAPRCISLKVLGS